MWTGILLTTHALHWLLYEVAIKIQWHDRCPEDVEHVLQPTWAVEQIHSPTQLLSIASSPTSLESMAQMPGSLRAHPMAYPVREPSEQPCPTVEHSLGPHLSTEPKQWCWGAMELSLQTHPAADPCLMGPAQLLKTACSLTQAGSPSNDPAQSWSITCSPTWLGRLGSHLSKCAVQSQGPHNFRVKLEAMPNHRAWPVTSPKVEHSQWPTQMQSLAYRPSQLQGRACDHTWSQSKAWGPIQLWSLTCDSTWTQSLVSNTIQLRRIAWGPTWTGTIANHIPQACQLAEYNQWHCLARKHSLWPFLTRSDFRAQLVAPPGSRTQPSAPLD